ncbi:hypothetical protein AAHB54_04535, partial [Bacillus cereus]
CTSFQFQQMRCLAFGGTNQVTCFRIYRETLSRFSCAASMIMKCQLRQTLVRFIMCLGVYVPQENTIG